MARSIPLAAAKGEWFLGFLGDLAKYVVFPTRFGAGRGRRRFAVAVRKKLTSDRRPRYTEASTGLPTRRDPLRVLPRDLLPYASCPERFSPDAAFSTPWPFRCQRRLF